MPSQRHEQVTQLLGLFVSRLTEELEVPYEPLGMTTLEACRPRSGT